MEICRQCPTFWSAVQLEQRAKTSKRSFVGQLVTCVNMGSNQPHLTQKVDFLKVVTWNAEKKFRARSVA